MGEPPVAADPRRWGGLVGLAGGMVFIASYSSALGPVVAAVAWAAGIALVLAALFAHYVRPVPLGPLVRPRPLAMAVYGGCVMGEVVIIATGSNALAEAGRSELRPALIAAVVGVHFLPFAWAFGERMFLGLGSAVAGLGVVGLVVGGLGVRHAAEAAAVLAGLLMLGMSTMYARGRFAPSPAAQPTDEGSHVS